MARKKAPYMVFETKEEFDKMWDELVTNAELHGRAEGFRQGCIWVSSYIEELFQSLFKPETFALIEAEIRNRQIEEWRKTKKVETLKDTLDRGWTTKLFWGNSDDRE